MGLFSRKKKKNVNENKDFVQQKRLTLTDIKDDDMMAAVLVATMDYTNELKDKNIRLVSIKQIN